MSEQATDPTTATTGERSPLAAPVDEVAAHTASARGTLIERMGIELLEVGDERIVARMPVDGNTQPYGLLHGGASVVLAETLGSIGSARHAAKENRIAVGLDINATHHRAARSGWVTGVATPLSLGRSVATFEVIITDEEDKRVCTSRITCLVRDLPPGAPGTRA